MKLILSALAFLSMLSLTSLAQAAVSVDLKALEASLEKDVTGPAFTKVILPLEGFLVQNTFAELAKKSFGKEELVTIVSVKNEARYYVIAPQAIELLTYLANKKISIVTVTSLEDQEAKQILQQLKLPTLNKTASAVATLGSMDWTEKINAKDFGSVDKTLVIAYESMSVTPADQVIQVGPYFRPFKNFETAALYREKADEKYHYLYPVDEAAWKSERFKVARALYLLRATNLNDKATFKQKMAEVKKVKPLELSQLGRAFSQDLQRLAFAWSGPAGSMECQVYDRVQRKNIQQAQFEDCLQTAGAIGKFKIDQKTRRATSCELSFEDKVIKQVNDPALCLANTEEKTFAFDFGTKKCSVFSSDNALLATLDDAKSCGKSDYKIYDPRENDWQDFKAFKGMESLQSSELLKKYFEWTARSPLKYSSSLHSMMMDDTSKVREVYDKGCGESIKAFLKSGKNFYSKELLARSVLAREYPREDVQTLNLRHYTDADVLTKIGQERKFNDLYGFLRGKCNQRFHNCMSGWFFYVASDGISSHKFGKLAYNIKLRKNAKIFKLLDDKSQGEQYFWNTVDAIEEELFKKDEGLRACERRGAKIAIPNTPSMLVALAAEASGVDAIAYFGLNNWNANGEDVGYQWLTLVGPWSIESLKLKQ